MGFLSWFFITILTLSYVELTLLVKVSVEIGFLGTLALCFITAIVGGTLVRTEGFSVLREMQLKLAKGQDPSSVIVGGVLLFISGVLLLVPGFVTDAFGFLCLLKPFRERVGAIIFRNIKGKINFGSGFRTNGASGFEASFKSYTYHNGSQFKSERTVEGQRDSGEGQNSHTNQEVNRDGNVIDVDFKDSNK